MLLREEDSSIFKHWLLPKLETISDADAEVLADYVIALVTANDTESNIRKNCIESLADFLQNNTESFVNDVVYCLKNKSYLSSSAIRKPLTGTTASIPSVLNATAPEYDPNNPRITDSPPRGAPRRPAGLRSSNLQTHNAGGEGCAQFSRKRKAPGRDTSEVPGSRDQHYNHNDSGRQIKQTSRRTGRNTTAPIGNSADFMSAFATMPKMANLPPPPPGLPPFDLNDPMAMMTMMALMGGNISNMPTLAVPEQGHERREKCSDYHEKGFCSLGNLCHFEHEDPSKRILSRASKRTGKGQAKGGRRRASFSMTGPSYDEANTALVIEQIPRNHLNEADIRDFFNQYGPVTNIDVQPHRRLALIEFENHTSADKAYRSPKAVFENRFVKVFWHKPENFSVDDSAVPNRDDEEPLDLEEIQKRQAEAQKAFKERQKRQEAADARAAEIDKLMREKDDEMAEIRRQLAALAADKGMEGMEEEHSQTLAKLQAEAESLLANHDFSTSAGRQIPPEKGYSNGGSAPDSSHGRGYVPPGSFSNRGGYQGPPRARYSRFKKLDNRPKRLAVSGITKGSVKDEALRQFLFNVDGCTSIDLDPEHPHTVILTFQERRHAEEFLDSSLNIPDMGGPLDLAWVPNTVLPDTAVQPTTAHDDGDSSDTIEEHTIKQEEEDHAATGNDVDMDVADDVDHWL